jgi:hypothetical protein
MENNSYTLCRTLGHAWAENEEQGDVVDGIVPLTLNCLRCKMERRDGIDVRTGQLLQRSYVYPQDYLIKKGQRRPKRHEYRLVLLAERLAALKKGSKR